MSTHSALYECRRIRNNQWYFPVSSKPHFTNISLVFHKAFKALLKQSKGRIISVTSVAGRVSLPYTGPYSVGKFASEAYMDCIRWVFHALMEGHLDNRKSKKRCLFFRANFAYPSSLLCRILSVSLASPSLLDISTGVGEVMLPGRKFEYR
uniref:Uncharacterized protein n=1 Tax=Parascaris equorum TaxID=6256 RepID=A0A914RGM4_PAREQ